MEVICEKPLTENQKKIANTIYAYLIKEHRFVTKQELCAMLGWEYNITNDRKVRDCVNAIKHRRAIVATPDRKGYFAPKNENDLEEIIHQWRYLDKLEEEIKATKKPIIEFYEKYKYKEN